MKITILNGNPGADLGLSSPGFDEYLAALKGELEAGSHSVTLLNLRDLDLKHCVGCWNCWVKTPGECTTRDDGPRMRRTILGADFVLHASPLIMGYPSALSKKALDKSIPLIHPYMAIVNGEFHHRARYERYPRLGLLVQKEANTEEADLRITADLFARTALNMKTGLAFARDTSASVEEVAALIADASLPFLQPSSRPEARPGARIEPPTRLTVFNGSPRGAKGNTPIMLREFVQGFTSVEGNSVETFDLVHQNDLDGYAQAFSEAQCVLLGFPLYTDSMPGIVKAFIDRLAPLAGRAGNPPVAFLVQSGFPEALHSRYVEQYLEKLATRLGSPYLGTMVKGNGEGTRLMPDQMNRGLFTTLQGLGKGLAAGGRLDPALLRKLAVPERMPGFLMPMVRLSVAMGAANAYWNGMLKENGALDRVWDKPYR